MLSRYRDDARIMHVSGDNFGNGMRRGAGSYYFSRYSLSWGWASWRRAWRYYDLNLSCWPVARKEGWLASILDDPLEVEYWTGIFDKLHRGEIDTWDYQWLFTCWCQSGLSVLPNANLVTNIGAGPDALHYKENNGLIGIPTSELDECVDPVVVIRDKEADRFTFEEHIAGRQMREERVWYRTVIKRLAVRSRIKRLLQRFIVPGAVRNAAL